MTTASSKSNMEKSDKKQINSPYKKLRVAAKQNSALKHTKGAVQIRVGLMLIGIIIAVTVYAFPTLSAFFNKSHTSQGKEQKKKTMYYFSKWKD